MAFKRPASAFRNELGSEEFPFEAGRYFLYVSKACPWANGAMMAARLLGLIGSDNSGDHPMKLCVVHPTWQYTDPDADLAAAKKRNVTATAAGVIATDPHAGWVFAAPNKPVLPMAVMKNSKDFDLQLPGAPEQLCAAPDSTNFVNLETWSEGKDVLAAYGVRSSGSMEDISKHRARNLRQLYEKAGGFLSEGVRATTPMIWDTTTDLVVSNESIDILKFFNTWGLSLGKGAPDLYPEGLRKEIDEMIEWVYPINNGVYRCGFASSAPAYNAAAEELEARMLQLEQYLGEGGGRKFLAGGQLTIVDLRLFNTLVRMDEVYVVYFKCYFVSLLGGRFPNLLRYTAAIYNDFPEVRESVSMEDIMNHYFTSHTIRNFYAVVPRPVGFLQKIAAMK